MYLYIVHKSPTRFAKHSAFCICCVRDNKIAYICVFCPPSVYPPNQPQFECCISYNDKQAIATLKVSSHVCIHCAIYAFTYLIRKQT